MSQKINFLKPFGLLSLICTVLFLITGCGKPIQSARTEATGGGNGNNTGGGVPTPTPPMGNYAVSCTLTAGDATYTEAPLTLLVVGPVDKVMIDGNVVPNPDPFTHTLSVKYPIVLPGNKTVNAVVQNNGGGSSGCATQFVAPDLAKDRELKPPSDGANFVYSQDVLITDPSNKVFRYQFSVSKTTGQGYYNSIPLDISYKPGVLDAWTGFKVIPGQPSGTGTFFKPVILKITPSTYSITAVNFDGTVVYTIATCSAGTCTFTPWDDY